MLISEADFERLCEGIAEDRAIILKHNPMGTANESLLWMLLGCLVSYLSLSDSETPCFPGKPDEAAYRLAIEQIMASRKQGDFDASIYMDRLLSE
jgi:ribonucleotide monophosphatase NagD (HAD superfamily)